MRISTAASAQLWYDCRYRSCWNSLQVADVRLACKSRWAVLAYLCVFTSESDPTFCTLTSFLQVSSRKQLRNMMIPALITIFSGHIAHCSSPSDESNTGICVTSQKGQWWIRKAKRLKWAFHTCALRGRLQGGWAHTDSGFAGEMMRNGYLFVWLIIGVKCHTVPRHPQTVEITGRKH